MAFLKGTMIGLEENRRLPALPPTVDPMPAFSDALIAETMNQLSMGERKKVVEDIHGVADVIEEDPKFVERCLSELEIEISKVPDKEAYETAKSMSAIYVSNRKFCLQFLRADSFNVKEAAIRIVGYFAAKLDLFGSEFLAKDIMQKDLDESDMECLESGFMQLLAGRDRAGRSIICITPGSVGSIRNKLRTVWYIYQSALEDQETQKKGFVALVYNVCNRTPADRVAVWKKCKLLAALPVRFASMHYCYDDPTKQLIFALASTVLASQTRTRLRAHCGSHVECLYSLLTFGIPRAVIPVETTGEIKIDNHADFLKHQRFKEEEILARSQRQDNIILVPNSLDRIIVPSTLDILSGRGRTVQFHPGNIRFRNILEMHGDDYDKADRFNKTVLAEVVVGVIRKWGSRFLKRDKAGWLEITDDSVVREKVSHGFRNRRRGGNAGGNRSVPTPPIALGNESASFLSADSSGSTRCRVSNILPTALPDLNKRRKIL